MKLTHVAVEGCGRFGKPARIEGLGPGVNILSAGNEAGKSTLFRAVRTCLFERHNSVAKEIAALATEGLTLPVTIAVGFETGGKTYEIRKSFLRSKAASLVCDGVELARNAAADEEVWKLLGIEQKSARALDEAAYGILWVAQGHSFHTPEPSEGAKSAFNAVIQQEVGTLVGGERARQLLNNVSDELSKYVTKTGPKANGPLDLALKDSARLSAELQDAEMLLAGLRARIEDLDTLRREWKVASDPAAVQSLKDQFEDARRALAEAETAAEGIRRLAAEEAQARQWAAAQQEKHEQLMKQAAAIDAARQRLKRLAGELAPLDAKHGAAGEALREASAARSACEDELTALEARASELQRIEAAARKRAQRAELEARLALLTDFRSRAAANEAALKEHSVDEAAVAALEAVEREEARIRAMIEAGAARVAIAASPGADVTLNGEPVAGQASEPVTRPLAITVGSQVTITVLPPAGTLDEAAGELAKQRAARGALLARHGVGTAAELRQRRGERVSLEDAARDLRAERAALALKDTLAAEIDRLAAAIAGIDAGPAAQPPAAPEDAAAEAQAIAARLGDLRAARSSLDAQISGHREALTSLAGTRGGLKGQMEAINAQLETALAQLPDDARAGALAGCAEELEKRREAHLIKAAALERERASAPTPEETERLRSRAERYQQALAAQAKKAEDLRARIARLEGEVAIAGGQGLGEHAAALRLQQEMAEAEVGRLNHRVEVLKLLRDTVEGCYARRREELNAPLLRHLKPFLNDVFPEAEISLGEDFAISGLSRTGPAAELFGRLSLGTQEQVAVLVRLAMGAMIAERGEAVPVILDDALVFSDDQRIERMFDAINRAGRRQQVIVLTCRARSFASLGARELEIV